MYSTIVLCDYITVYISQLFELCRLLIVLLLTHVCAVDYTTVYNLWFHMFHSTCDQLSCEHSLIC